MSNTDDFDDINEMVVFIETQPPSEAGYEIWLLEPEGEENIKQTLIRHVPYGDFEAELEAWQNNGFLVAIAPLELAEGE